MKIVRTYPTLNPENLRGRNRIEDEFPRHYMNDYDNHGLLSFKDNLVVLEWDMAVDPEHLEIFCERAAETPDDILVAPYKIATEGLSVNESFVYCHRIITNEATLSYRWVRPGDWECDLFGFGMIYLPHELIKEFLADPNFAPHDRRMTDANFSIWYHRKFHKKVPIAWNIQPIHLHYTCPKRWPWKTLNTSLEVGEVSGT